MMGFIDNPAISSQREVLMLSNKLLSGTGTKKKPSKKTTPKNLITN